MNKRQRKKMWKKYLAGEPVTWRQRDYIRHYFWGGGLMRDAARVFIKAAKAARAFAEAFAGRGVEE